MQRMLVQARAMEDALIAAQDELSSEVVEGRSADGAVKIKLSGALAVKRVRITPGAIDPEDVKGLEKAVSTAIEDALVQARDHAARRAAEVAGGLGR